MTDQGKVEKQGIIIQDLRNGSTDAFRIFFEKCYPVFFAFAELLIHDKVSAQHVTVEAFFLLWAKHGDFDTEQTIRVFLYSTIRDNSLSYLSHLRDNPKAGKYTSEAVRTGASLPAALIRELLGFADKF